MTGAIGICVQNDTGVALNGDDAGGLVRTLGEQVAKYAGSVPHWLMRCILDVVLSPCRTESIKRHYASTP
jgi:hypothetical protein